MMVKHEPKNCGAHWSALSGVRILGIVCLMLIAGFGSAAAAASYLGPVAVVASKDGKRLFVANTDARQVAVVDVASGEVTRSIEVPAAPTGMVLSPDGARLYVACAAAKSTIVVLDTASGKELASIPSGHTAGGPAISPDGKVLYVCNRFDNRVAVIDLAANKEVARVATIREPVAAAITPDGATLFVANLLPLDPSDSNDVAAEVTVIDTASRKASSIRLPNGSTALRDICVSPDGKYAYAVHILGRYQLPATQVERGWMNSSAMSVIDIAEKKLLNTVLLDDVELGAANPWGVACTADGASICVTHAGTHELSVIDSKGLLKRLLAEPDGREKAVNDVYNDLAFLVGLRRRVGLQGRSLSEPVDRTQVNGPRGLAILGTKVFAAAYFSDNLAVVELKPKHGKGISTIALGPKPKLTGQRRGEMNFHDATLCLQQWQSCASCHGDARMDGLNRDLLNDGPGTPKNTKSLLLSHRTSPAMSTGNIPNAETEVRKGLAHLLFSQRPEADAVAIDEYLKSLEPLPSPHLVDGKLSPAAERGKLLFVAKQVDCIECHSEGLYTDQMLHDVGSKAPYDRSESFDTPTLIESWRTAPYLHSGQYTTVKELLVKGNHNKKTKKLSEEQLDDLIEYVLSL